MHRRFLAASVCLLLLLALCFGSAAALGRVRPGAAAYPDESKFFDMDTGAFDIHAYRTVRSQWRETHRLF